MGYSYLLNSSGVWLINAPQKWNWYADTKFSKPWSKNGHLKYYRLKTTGDPHHSSLEHSKVLDSHFCSRSSAGEGKLLVKNLPTCRKYRIRKRGGCGGRLKRKHLQKPAVALQLKLLETIEKFRDSAYSLWREETGKMANKKHGEKSSRRVAEVLSTMRFM